MGNHIDRKTAEAAAWSSFTEIAAKLMTPVVNMILARLLVPEAFGIVATISMVISFAEIFTDAGFQKYLIQHEFPDRESLDNSTNVAFWTNLAVSVLICIGIFLFRHPIAAAVGNSGLGNAISISSVLIILAAFSSIQTARYRRALDFRTLFFVRVSTALIPLFVTVPLAFLLRNYRALMIGTGAVELFRAVVLTIRSPWKPRFYYDIKLLRDMFSFSMWTLLESISIWATLNAGIFIVGNVLSEYYLGLYKVALNTVSACMSVITGSLTPVFFSALSRCQNDEGQFRMTCFSFQRLYALLILPLGVGLFVYRDLVTQILLGNQWTEASGFIGLWGLIYSLEVVFSHPASEVYRSKGQPKVSLMMQLLHLVFLIPALRISVSYGFEALYISRSLIRLQLILSALLILRFHYRFRLRQIFGNVAPMLITSVIMGIAGYLFQTVSTSFIWQFVSVFLCAILYFVLLLLFPNVRQEMGQLLFFRNRKKDSLAKMMCSDSTDEV